MAARKLIPTYDVLAYFNDATKQIISQGYFNKNVSELLNKFYDNVFMYGAPVEDDAKDSFWSETDKKNLVIMQQAMRCLYDVLNNAKDRETEGVRVEQTEATKLYNALQAIQDINYAELLEHMLLVTLINEPDMQADEKINMYWNYRVIKSIMQGVEPLD